MTTMTITAKFNSVCPCCGNRISAGEKVEWTKGSKAHHVACASKPGAKAVPNQSRTERVYKSRYGWDGVRGSSSYYSSGMYDEES